MSIAIGRPFTMTDAPFVMPPGSRRKHNWDHCLCSCHGHSCGEMGSLCDHHPSHEERNCRAIPRRVGDLERELAHYEQGADE